MHSTHKSRPKPLSRAACPLLAFAGEWLLPPLVFPSPATSCFHSPSILSHVPGTILWGSKPLALARSPGPHPHHFTYLTLYISHTPLLPIGRLVACILCYKINVLCFTGLGKTPMCHFPIEPLIPPHISFDCMIGQPWQQPITLFGVYFK